MALGHVISYLPLSCFVAPVLDTAPIWQGIAGNDKVTTEWRTGRDVETSSRGLVEALYTQYLTAAEKNYQKRAEIRNRYFLHTSQAHCRYSCFSSRSLYSQVMALCQQGSAKFLPSTSINFPKISLFYAWPLKIRQAAQFVLSCHPLYCHAIRCTAMPLCNVALLFLAGVPAAYCSWPSKPCVTRIYLAHYTPHVLNLAEPSMESVKQLLHNRKYSRQWKHTYFITQII
jgi:hypothetical protein